LTNVFRRELGEIAMTTRKGLISSAGRSLVLAALAIASVAASGTPSAAASAPPLSKSVSAKPTASDVTDFSAARRYRYYRRGASAAGLAFMGIATGLAAGAIAEQRRRDYYENNYYYGPGAYYGSGYYGGGPYYGPRYYYQPY
jgi:hypothetical protein